MVTELKSEDDFSHHNEPYLGFWWIFLILFMIYIKESFLTTPGTFLWWVHTYYTAIVCMIAGFTVYKRLKYDIEQKK